MFATDDAIFNHTEAFLDHSLPECQWSHEGHFAAALALIRRQGLKKTEDTMPEQIRQFNLAKGGENTDSAGYHHTITLASLRAAKKILDDVGPNASLPTALRTLMESEFGQTRWLQTYWTTATLLSVTARREWVAPDLDAPEWLVSPAA